MPWPSLPLIDNFTRTESPISDGGKWYSPKIGGADYQEINQFPFPGDNWSVKHQNWGDVLHPPAGPAYAVRTSSPGVGLDMAIELFCAGLMGTAYRILRMDWGGNGYVVAASGGGLGTQMRIYKSVGWVNTLLASGSVGIGAGNLYIGAMAAGDEISGWYADVYPPSTRYQVVSVTDTTYAAGFVGYGGEGGVFGSMAQQACYGSTSLARVNGVWVSSVRDPHNQTSPQIS